MHIPALIAFDMRLIPRYRPVQRLVRIDDDARCAVGGFVLIDGKSIGADRQTGCADMAAQRIIRRTGQFALRRIGKQGADMALKAIKQQMLQ